MRNVYANQYVNGVQQTSRVYGGSGQSNLRTLHAVIRRRLRRRYVQHTLHSYCWNGLNEKSNAVNNTCKKAFSSIFLSRIFYLMNYFLNFFIHLQT